MRINVLARRILAELRHDKRTLGLVLVAPLVILTLLYFILNGTGATYTVVAGDVPEAIVNEMLDNEDVNIKIVDTNGDKWSDSVKEGDYAVLRKSLAENKAVAAISVDDDLSEAVIFIDGTNATDANKVKAAFTKAYSSYASDKQKEALSNLPIQIDTDIPEISTDYVYGNDSRSMFDTFSSALVGLIVFFFVFLIAGINFLSERISGTLEKMLSTPITRYEIVLGYTLGYSVLAIIQTVIITLFVVYIIGVDVKGGMGLVFLINILTAICALTMGTLISCLANSEFQMVQFIPIVVIPQVFLCGLFSLSKGWDIVGHLVPLYYSAHCLQNVIIRGSGFGDIWQYILILVAFSVIFIVANILNLKKYRRW